MSPRDREREPVLPLSSVTQKPIITCEVNNAITVQLGSGIEANGMRILRAIPELTVLKAQEPIIGPYGLHSWADAVVTYGDANIPIAIEFKTRVSAAQAHLIVKQAQRFKMPMVVVAGTMTGKAREVLAHAGIGSVDGLGNVRLDLPGLLMRITGTKRVRRPVPATRLSGKSGLVAQAMLLDVGRDWHVSDLSRRCSVSTGLVSRILHRLEKEGVVQTYGAGPHKTRKLSNPSALLDLWAEEQHDRPFRQPAFMLAQTTDHLVTSLCAGLDRADVDYALTGAAAAARLAPFITNIPVTEVWLASTADAGEVVSNLGGRPVESGPNVLLLQERDEGPLTFRTREDDVWMVNLFRLYFDLRRDPRRGREQSDHLRTETIGF